MINYLIIKSKIRPYLKNLILNKSSILPDGYKQVKYIESSGTQYIDTGYVPNNNTKVDIKFMGVNNTATVVPLFGARTTAEKATYTTFYKAGSDGRVDYGKYSPSAPTIQFRGNNLYTFVKDKEKNYLDGEYVNSNDPMEFSCSYPMYINSINTAGTPSATGLKGKLYYTKIYDNNKLVRDLVPVVKKASKNLWDEQLENGTLNENASPIGSTYPQCKGETASQRVRSVNVIHTNGVAAISFNNTKYNLFVLYFDNDALYTGRYEGWKTGTFTVNSPYIGIVIKPISGNISPDADDFNIMINSGSTALPYEPYSPEQVGMYDLSATSKNLLCESATTTYTGDLSIKTVANSSKVFLTKSTTSQAVSTASDVNISLDAGTYTISVQGLNSFSDNFDRLFIRDSNNNIVVQDIRVDASKTFTISSTTILSKVIFVARANSEYNDTEVNIMLNEGSTALPYEPYQKRFYTNDGTGEFLYK